MRVKLFSLLAILLLLISACSNQTSKEGLSESSEEDAPKIVKVIIEKVDPSNFYVVNTAEGEELEYAYYVYKDNEVIDKFYYKKDAHFTYKVKEPGSYKVKAYIKDKNEEKVSKFTKAIEMEM